MDFPEYTVIQLSYALKNLVEQGFSNVRVRGELSGVKRHTSGHIYGTLKDADAVLDVVCWRGTAERYLETLQDGREVICLGRLTTYPGRSKYQMVITAVEQTGIGSLLVQLQALKEALAAEGLFAPERKRPIPAFPKVIGVITSPTGAVIQDILHRLKDRLPRPVLLWPVLVQGPGAAAEIATAIHGMNRLLDQPRPARLPIPDVLIVARGGGSLEDLWAFNEAIVVRAVAESRIPVISAVGHETDTTLIDFAADRRAPTPSAAAEMAVPSRPLLYERLQDQQRSLDRWMRQKLHAYTVQLDGLARGLKEPRRYLEDKMQRLDEMWMRGQRGMEGTLRQAQNRLERVGALLESYSHHKTLERGFVLVQDALGRPVMSAAQLNIGDALQLTLRDGTVDAHVEGRHLSSRDGGG